MLSSDQSTDTFNAAFSRDGRTTMQGVTGKKILIVDDDRANCDMGATALRKAGFEVFAAYSGNAALPLFQAQHPDMVILDFAMPGMNGIEVAVEIRKMEDPSKHIPILMLTA